jgi:hypothetical protein
LQCSFIWLIQRFSQELLFFLGVIICILLKLCMWLRRLQLKIVVLYRCVEANRDSFSGILGIYLNTLMTNEELKLVKYKYFITRLCKWTHQFNHSEKYTINCDNINKIDNDLIYIIYNR